MEPKFDDLNNKQLDAKETHINDIRRRVDKIIRKTVGKIYDHNLNYFIPSAKAELSAFLPEVSDIGARIDAALEGVEERDVAVENISKLTINLIAQHLTLKDVEHRMLERFKKRHPDYMIVGRGLACEIRGNELMLHVPTTFFESSKIALETYAESFAKLAKLLQEDPQFKEIEKIVGISDLVEEKRFLLAKNGFYVPLDENKKATTNVATISKEDFLRLHSKQ